jgi:6-phosphofructokinase 1
MNIPTLGEARFASRLSHTIGDGQRIPERIEMGADAGLQIELAAPRAKLFFDPKQTHAGIVKCGGFSSVRLSRATVSEFHYRIFFPDGWSDEQPCRS